MEDIPMVRDIMSRPHGSLHPEDDIYHAVEALAKGETGAMCVKNDEGALVGILTDKDCLRVLSSAFYASCSVLVEGKVKDYMSPVTVFLTPAMDVFTAATLFLQTSFTHLPVVSEEQVAGCVSRRMLLGVLSEMDKKNVLRKVNADTLRKMMEQPHSVDEIMKLVADQGKRQLVRVFHWRRRGEE